ncbi:MULTISPECIES: hypothetical protein [Okeania]|uniref:hypothetical protein n=1 Tax=Okeania TaxID=1458928 RepID=UPI0013751684|nr:MULTISPECIES: hypothetical protein [Okeania]NET13422.1 hypothetical protein [Okeania sp. SIO1H6]NES76747.1 hypothetical protein [Okeania sp. SIO1H4]NES88202.1 hypothetical protein [Okeania sp. SIO2B9]NET20674.1 hypothetical protein [Okeania sp. SIO1H5]NET75667.1 hypothetical protein [Okeania sp. SIO1F9]
MSELNQQEKKLRKQEQDLIFREMSQPISLNIKYQRKHIKKLEIEEKSEQNDKLKNQD